MVEHERIALSFIALIMGLTAFIESMVAVPAASTALAADALSFVQHSASAGLALRAASGLMRPRWAPSAQGAVMILPGTLVCVIAARRFLMGSVPHPLIMIVMGAVALAANLCACAVLLYARGQLSGVAALWRVGRADAVGNIAVIAAASAVVATGSNIPDLVIGAAMAGLFIGAGWRVLRTGRPGTG